MKQGLILYPALIPILNRIKDDSKRVTGYQIRETETYRSSKIQSDRYAQGRTTPGKIITNAKAGQSWHEYGLAIDLCFTGVDPYLEGLRKSNKDRADHSWKKLGELVIAYGFEWGGNFKLLKDMPHIQMRYGLTIHEAQELYRNGGLRGVWTYIDQMRNQNTEKQWPDFEKLC